MEFEVVNIYKNKGKKRVGKREVPLGCRPFKASANPQGALESHLSISIVLVRLGWLDLCTST